MKPGLVRLCFYLISAIGFSLSCQKEVDGTTEGAILPANQKPKLGTQWTYNYTTYLATGGVQESKTLTLKAKSEQSHGGENWLNIVDTETDTTVYLLKTKTGGLFQYTNNNAHLLCKYPASLNDSYTTFNQGETEDFIVKGVNDSLATGIGVVASNYYEGTKNGFIIDYIWYNDNAWLVRQIKWIKKPPPSTAYYRRSTLYIQSIIY